MHTSYPKIVDKCMYIRYKLLSISRMVTDKDKKHSNEKDIMTRYETTESKIQLYKLCWNKHVANVRTLDKLSNYL